VTGSPFGSNGSERRLEEAWHKLHRDANGDAVRDECVTGCHGGLFGMFLWLEVLRTISLCKGWVMDKPKGPLAGNQQGDLGGFHKEPPNQRNQR